jgi:antitoxin ParD1/3/4
MQSMNISLPDPLKQFVDEQISSGRYSSVSEYVRELIREDEKRKAQQHLEGLLLEGLNSKAGRMTSKDGEELKQRARQRQAKRSPR